MKLTLTSKEVIPSVEAVAFEIRRINFLTADNELMINYVKLNANGDVVGRARKIITAPLVINNLYKAATDAQNLLARCYDIIKKDSAGVVE